MDPLTPEVSATGVLLREGTGFVLKDDQGRRWTLDLPRVPVDLVAKRARIEGNETGAGRLEVTAIAAG